MASTPGRGRPPKLWRNEKMVRLVEGGASVKDVAEWFGVSPGRVSQILARHGVKAWDHKPRDPDSTQQRVLELLEAEWSQADIARELGVSRQRVHAIVQKVKDRIRNGKM